MYKFRTATRPEKYLNAQNELIKCLVGCIIFKESFAAFTHNYKLLIFVISMHCYATQYQREISRFEIIMGFQPVGTIAVELKNLLYFQSEL